MKADRKSLPKYIAKYSPGRQEGHDDTERAIGSLFRWIQIAVEKCNASKNKEIHQRRDDLELVRRQLQH